MAVELPEGWPKDKPMAVCVNIPLEWWEDGVSPGTAPQANPLRQGVVDTAAIQWAEYAMTTGIYRMCDIAEEFGVKIGCHASAIVMKQYCMTIAPAWKTKFARIKFQTSVSA